MLEKRGHAKKRLMRLAIDGDADVAPGAEIALADGSVVVTDGFGAWRVRDGQMRVVVPARRDIHWISSLAPLESGAFAFDDLAHDRVVRVEQDGSRRVLASLAFDDALNASLAARGDDLVVVHGDAEGSRSRHVLSYFKGTSLVGSVRAGREARVYGDGDGFGAAGLVGSWAERAWLGGDGALLLLAGCSLRALVPGGSPRARTRCAHRRGAAHARLRLNGVRVLDDEVRC
jgi:hypothetical protein